jgi:predicted membrane protein
MFPREKIDFLYRIMCLLAYLIVIIFIDSIMTLFIITIAFYILTIMEKRFENIFLYIVTGIIFILCLTMNNYFLLRLIAIVDYMHYFMNVDSIDDDFDEIDEVVEKDQNYIRFKSEKEERVKDNNGLCTVFVLVHLGLLIISIMVG